MYDGSGSTFDIPRRARGSNKKKVLTGRYRVLPHDTLNEFACVFELPISSTEAGAENLHRESQKKEITQPS